jgi:hypothetical protein
VQNRFRRNAADVQAGAADLRGGVDECDFLTFVGGEEGGGVAAGAGAEDDELGIDCFWHGSVGWLVVVLKHVKLFSTQISFVPRQPDDIA